MLSHVLKAVIEETKIDSNLVEDVVVGNVLLPGAGTIYFRTAQIMSGFSEDVPITSVSRFCSSGLEAVAMVTAKIQSGVIQCGIGAGVESMTLGDMTGLFNPDMMSDKVFDNEKATNCLIPMGMTSEILAERFKLQRKRLD